MTGFYWLASYPKSGNTWVRFLLDQLITGCRPVDLSTPLPFATAAASRSEMDLYLNISSSDLTPDEQVELRPDLTRALAHSAISPQFRKVHDHWGRTPSGRLMFPPDCTRATVYIVRDPRDVAVSWSHHSGLGIDDTITFMNDPKTVLARTNRWKDQLVQPIGSWSQHVTSWLSADPAPLVVSYEDLSTSPAETLARIATHCHLDAGADAITAAVSATRFNRLQAAEQDTAYDLGQVRGRKFFRRGLAGGWRDTLTADQAARINKDHRAVMERLGYL